MPAHGAVGVGAEVNAVLVDAAGGNYARILVVGNFDIRVAHRSLQIDIEFRLVFVNEGLFQKQSFNLGVRGDKFHVANFGN